MIDTRTKRCAGLMCAIEPAYLMTYPAIDKGHRWFCRVHLPPEWGPMPTITQQPRIEKKAFT